METRGPALATSRSWLDGRPRRVLDVLLAGLGLVIVTPLLAVLALAIRGDDGGPILFRQARTGRGRRRFEVWKLRTMRDGTVTRVGRWLRSTGLDELPQLVHVVRGEMSLVGPRPLTPADVARLGWEGSDHDARFALAPGITGLAQVLAPAGARAAARLDRLYGARAGAALDLALIAAAAVINVAGKRRTRAGIGRLRAAARGRRRQALQARAQERDRRLPRPMREAPPLDPRRPTPPPRPRHALLINPFYRKDATASFGKHVLTPTLALTSIGGATPPDWTVAYHDENLLQGPPPLDPFPEVVGISVHLTFARRAFELARFYRERGARVVLGGLHVTSSPGECAPHADALAIGEGVQLWPRILADAARGRLAPRYHADFRRPYRDEPAPRRALLDRAAYLTTTSLIATRGCHNRCGFCYLATDGLNMPYQMRAVEQVVAELVADGQPYAVFTDNNLGSRRAYLRSLCRALRPLDRIWSAAVTIDVTDDPALVREMALSGCTAVFIGFESLTGDNLDDAGKKTPRPEDYARRVDLLHQNGIAVNGSFVLGFDHDRPDVFERTAAWVERNRLECATFHILTPYPGTPLFRQMESEGRLLHRDWDLYDTSHAVFRPRHMSPSELERGYDECYRRLFSLGSIWRRRPERTSEQLPYLAMSLLYKRANLIWPFLIRHRLVHLAWRPLVEAARRRHLRFRRRLAEAPAAAGAEGAGVPMYGGV